MIASSEVYFQKSLHWHYEDGCLNHVAKETLIPICFVRDLLWIEIDNADHYHRAQTMIWPQIRQIEAEASPENKAS